MADPVLSVVIPCYNHGQYIQEAIDSVLAYKGSDYEIIVVNDGSTDDLTIRKLQELEQAGYRVISQQNSGLATTRNVGIKAASGRFVLPLDADNKIKTAYIEKALYLLERDECDIVYAKPAFFGNLYAGREYTTRPFNIQEMMVENYIDACAMYKKEVWESLKGYDTAMPIPGQEDWEFWIHAFTKEYRFRFLDEELYYYRVATDSMIAQTVQADKNSLNARYIFSKHAALCREQFLKLYYLRNAHLRDMRNPVRTFFKYLSYKLSGRNADTTS